MIKKNTIEKVYCDFCKKKAYAKCSFCKKDICGGCQYKYVFTERLKKYQYKIVTDRRVCPECYHKAINFLNKKKTRRKHNKGIMFSNYNSKKAEQKKEIKKLYGKVSQRKIAKGH